LASVLLLAFLDELPPRSKPQNILLYCRHSLTWVVGHWICKWHELQCG